MKVCLEITHCRRVTAKPRVSHQHHQLDQRNDGSEVARQEERHEKKSLVSVEISRSQLRNSLTHINPALVSSVAGNWKQLRTAVRFSLAGCMGIKIVSLMNFSCWLGFS